MSETAFAKQRAEKQAAMEDLEKAMVDLHATVRDAPASAAGAGGSSGAGDGASMSAAAKRHPVTEDKQGGIDESFGLGEMMRRAAALQEKGRLKFAAHYYLYCLEHYRLTAAPQDIALCLRALADICYKNEKYEQAFQFRGAEKMVYESLLLQLAVERGELAEGVEDPSPAPTAAGAKKADGGGAPAAPDDDVAVRHAAAAAETTSSADAEVERDDYLKYLGRANPSTPGYLFDEERRAISYEKLGAMFLRDGNVKMAKAYALQSLELRRKIAERLDASDEVEARRVADLGRKQYEETLERYKLQNAGLNRPRADDADAAEATPPPGDAKKPGASSAPAAAAADAASTAAAAGRSGGGLLERRGLVAALVVLALAAAAAWQRGITGFAYI